MDMPKKPTLYLMLGYPGSGKTTAARAIHELTGAVHLWADQVRNERFPNPTHSRQENLALYDYLNGQTDELLAAGKSVIFDTGFNFYKDRQYLSTIAAKHEATVILVWVRVRKPLAHKRATHPSHAERNTYPQMMESDRFERISNDLELPQPGETVVNIDGTRITSDYIQAKLKI